MSGLKRALLLICFALAVPLTCLLVIAPESLHVDKDRYLGFNLLENFKVLPDERRKTPSDAVYYFFRFEPGYSLAKSLNNIDQLGSNTVVFNPLVWMRDKHSSEIFYDRRHTAQLIAAIRAARERGLKVFIRPQIQFLTSETALNWRGRIRPYRRSMSRRSGWRKWFAQYRQMSLYFCNIAAEGGAEVYVLGSELISSIRKMGYWYRLLRELQQKFSAGSINLKFTYNALYPLEFEYLEERIGRKARRYLRFFSALDHLGINFYTHIRNKNYYEDKKGLLRRNFSYQLDRLAKGYKIINSALSDYSQRNRKLPFVISEFGVKSTANAGMKPWIHPRADELMDLDEQKLYLGLGLEHFMQRPFISGVLLWHYSLDPFYGIKDFTGRRGKYNGEKSFAINGKPAEGQVRSIFYNARGLEASLRTNDVLFVAYALSGLLIIAFGLHRINLLRHLDRQRLCKTLPHNFTPFITVQLPVYNEPLVAEAVLEALLSQDYPAENMEVQILDDSTDSTTEVITNFLNRTKSFIDVRHIRRNNREGYKAGALANGLEQAKGDYVAIFDADFRPPAGFLRETVKYFAEPDVGMVQARWSFLNQDESYLTSVQALFLDGHFAIEHKARFLSGHFFNFNGTAGIFRKACITDSGGWQGDTLTEDLDLSYRAQLGGWKFIYLDALHVPSELPRTISGLKRQQRRWVKGSAQVLRKTFRSLQQSAFDRTLKLEALFHLSANAVYVFLFLLALSLLPTINLRSSHDYQSVWLLDVPLLLCGSFAMIVFYLKARSGTAGILPTLRTTLMGMLIGIGLSVNNTLAFIEGLLRIPSGFNRTLKLGMTDKGLPASRRRFRETIIPEEGVINLLEWCMTAYSMLTLLKVIELRMWSSLPFAVLFFFGFAIVALSTSIDWLLLKSFHKASFPGNNHDNTGKESLD